MCVALWATERDSIYPSAYADGSFYVALWAIVTRHVLPRLHPTNRQQSNYKKVTMSPTKLYTNPRNRLSVAVITLATVLAFQNITSAHPGHGVTPSGDSAAHYIVEPTHGISVAVVLFATLASALVIRHRANASAKRSGV